MNNTEVRFHQAMIDLYKQGQRDCNYNATIFLRMVTDYGGLQTAKKLLGTDKPSAGFATLWECHRLDLTVEAHVIKPEYAELFADDEIAIAKKRLTEHGYGLD